MKNVIVKCAFVANHEVPVSVLLAPEMLSDLDVTKALLWHEYREEAIKAGFDTGTAEDYADSMVQDEVQMVIADEKMIDPGDLND